MTARVSERAAIAVYASVMAVMSGLKLIIWMTGHRGTRIAVEQELGQEVAAASAAGAGAGVVAGVVAGVREMEALLELRREYLEEVVSRGEGRERQELEEENKRPRKAR